MAGKRDHLAKAMTEAEAVRAMTKANIADGMFDALRQVAFETSRQASLQALGPFAALFEEFVYRQSVLEDAIWYCPHCSSAKFCPPPLEPSIAPTCRVCSGAAVSMVRYAFVPKEKANAAP